MGGPRTPELVIQYKIINHTDFAAAGLLLLQSLSVSTWVVS